MLARHQIIWPVVAHDCKCLVTVSSQWRHWPARGVLDQFVDHRIQDVLYTGTLNVVLGCQVRGEKVRHHSPLAQLKSAFVVREEQVYISTYHIVHLHVMQSHKWIFRIILAHRNSSSSIPYQELTSIEILVHCFEPSHVVMRMGNQMHIEHPRLPGRTYLRGTGVWVASMSNSIVYRIAGA